MPRGHSSSTRTTTLRESIRSFVDREVVPHVEEWEDTTFPHSIVKRMGDLGFLGLSMPEEYGGQGGDYFTNIVLAEEIARSGSGGFLMGVSVHTDMVMPPILEFGTEEQKQTLARARDRRRRGSSALGITEPDAGLRRRRPSAPARSATATTG